MAILQLHSIARTARQEAVWVQRCKALVATHTQHTHTHYMYQTAPPKKQWVPRCHASEYTAATTSHSVCNPWSQMLAIVPLAPLRCNWPCSTQHWFVTHALEPSKRTPKFERLKHIAPTLARSSYLEQLSLRTPCHKVLHNLWHNEQSPACIVLGGSMHT